MAATRQVSAGWALTVAGVASALSAKLWADGQAGSDVSSAGSMLAGYVGLTQLFQGLCAYGRRRRVRRLKRRSRESAKLGGKATLAVTADLKDAGMFDPGSIFLGSHEGSDIYHAGETHLMTIAPPGSGKGTSHVVPNLLTDLRDKAHGNRPISTVVLDLKGELFATTAAQQRRMGREVIALCPFAAKLSAELGIDIPDAGFNPLSMIEIGPDVKDEAELVASLLLPGKPGDNSSSEFFQEGGQAILSWGILVLLATRERSQVTLPELRKLLLSPPAELEKLFAVGAECDDFNGAIREYAGKLIGTMTNAPEEFSGVLSTAQKALRIYDANGPLGKSVSGGGFDFARIKEKPTTVYVIIPSDRVGTHSGWLNLTLSLAMERVGRDRTNRRVLFLLDEFANAGYLPNVLRAMALYRSQGVMIWTIIQQISQLQRLYGEAGMREFLGMSELISVFGVWEFETLRVLSEMVGQRAVREVSQNLQPDTENGDNRSFSASGRSQPVIRPEDIRTQSRGKQLIFYRNMAPLIADLVDYRSRRRWRRRASANPYYRKG